MNENQQIKDALKKEGFISTFMEIHKNVALKRPYHINLIDELHANENAHSRILAKLLQQKVQKDNRFEILESFVRYLEKKSGSFGSITIKSPQITQGTEHIDVWIRDENYAIIVENKIHWASDPEAQIERYIDTTYRSYGFAEKPIYVIYLPPTDEKEPDKQSWGKYFKSEIYRERYLKLSFREDIRSWLQDDVLPNVRKKEKEVYLKSAIEQYIDHLEGLFDIRESDKQTNMELQEFIKKELGLNGIPREDTAKLGAKQEELNKVNNQLQSLKDDYEKEIFKEWNASLSKTYPDWKRNKDDALPVLFVQAKDIEIRVSIGIHNKQLYCQLDRDHLNNKADRFLPDEIKEKIKQRFSFPYDKEGRLWKYFPRYSYDEVYDQLIKVIEILIK
jgi:hypothetical protein